MIVCWRMYVSPGINGLNSRLIKSQISTNNFFCNVYLKAELRWFHYYIRVFCHKQISRPGTSNYIPQILWNIITCPWPWYLLCHNTSDIIMLPWFPFTNIHPWTFGHGQVTTLIIFWVWLAIHVITPNTAEAITCMSDYISLFSVDVIPYPCLYSVDGLVYLCL